MTTATDCINAVSRGDMDEAMTRATSAGGVEDDNHTPHRLSAILMGDASRSVRPHTCVTSPPLWGLRDYVSRPARPRTRRRRVVAQTGGLSGRGRVLRDDGPLMVNLGDSLRRFRRGGNPTPVNPAHLAKADRIQGSVDGSRRTGSLPRSGGDSRVTPQ